MGANYGLGFQTAYSLVNDYVQSRGQHLIGFNTKDTENYEFYVFAKKPDGNTESIEQ